MKEVTTTTTIFYPSTPAFALTNPGSTVTRPSSAPVAPSLILRQRHQPGLRKPRVLKNSRLSYITSSALGKVAWLTRCFVNSSIPAGNSAILSAIAHTRVSSLASGNAALIQPISAAVSAEMSLAVRI